MVSKTDIILINPGVVKKRIYQELSKDFSAVEPPFWAALTAAFIRNNKHTPEIIDANAENLTPEEIAGIVKSNPASIINIIAYGQQPSASTQLMGAIRATCSEIKKVSPEKKIIITGPHPSALPERTMKEEPCDFVCQGEGFFTILGLLEKKPVSEIPGLWYRKDNEILHNERAELIKDLDKELSDVAWDLLPMGKYKAHNWHCLSDLNSRMSYASISTSLGCPFNCSFCCINAPFGKPYYRTWSPKWVLKQIDTLARKYNIKNIKFIDELFVLKADHFIPIAEELAKREYKVNIWVYARIDTVKEEHLPILKKAGFNWFAIGIESGSEDVRKNVSKGRFSEKDIRNIAKKIQDNGIYIIGNYMVGLPEDNIESMQQTLNLAIELNCEFANIYCTTAYPGSRLYEETIKHGTPLPEKWEDYSQHAYNFIPLSTNYISAAEVLKFRDEAFMKYFKNPKYLEMVEKKFGRAERQHIEEMTKIKLKRKLLGD